MADLSRKPKILFFLVVLLFIALLGGSVSIIWAWQTNALLLISPLASSDSTRPHFVRKTETFSWKPDVDSVVATKSAKPELSAKAGLVMNLDSGKVYFIKNPTAKLPMASITKMMTALLIKENAKLSEVYTVSSFAANVGENTMALHAGEQYTVDELMWGLFLHSANDAAETLAENLAGSRQLFVKYMNERAKELGMTDTHYVNPSGMEGDGAMQTTAQDLAILTKYTLEHYPELLDYTKTIDHVLPKTATHKSVTLSSEIDLIRTYPGAIGFKTGYTGEAGYCIVTVTENKGQRMVAIVLGSKDRKPDAVKMLDYAYAQEGIKIIHPAYW